VKLELEANQIMQITRKISDVASTPKNHKQHYAKWKKKGNAICQCNFC